MTLFVVFGSLLPNQAPTAEQTRLSNVESLKSALTFRLIVWIIPDKSTVPVDFFLKKLKFLLQNLELQRYVNASLDVVLRHYFKLKLDWEGVWEQDLF